MNDMDWEFNIDKIIDDFKYEPIYDIYIAIENLLLADDKYQNNHSTYNKIFSINDYNKLLDTYITDASTKHTLKRLYFQCIKKSIPTTATSDSSNFHQMITGNRTINQHLISALKDVLIDGYVDIDKEQRYYAVSGLLRNELKNTALYFQITHHIRHCQFLTKLYSSSIKQTRILPYDELLDKGLTDIKQRDSYSSEELYKLYHECTSHLGNYFIQPYLQEDEFEYNSDQKEWIEEVTAQLAPPPPVPELDYSADRMRLDNIHKLKQLISALPNSHVLFLRNNLHHLLSLDKDFFKILYLVHFLAEHEMELIEKCVSEISYEMQTTSRTDFTNEIKQILAIPSFPLDFISLEWITDSKAESIAKQFYKQKATDITIYTLLNCKEEHLVLSKFLYITDVLPQKYGKMRCKSRSQFISDTLYTALSELKNVNIDRELNNIMADNIVFFDI